MFSFINNHKLSIVCNQNMCLFVKTFVVKVNAKSTAMMKTVIPSDFDICLLSGQKT